MKSGRGYIKKTIKKCQLYQNLDFNDLTTIYKCSDWEFSLFLIIYIYLQQIYVRTFLKLMIMIEHIKMIQIPCLDIWPMLLSGYLSHWSTSRNLFWNLRPCASWNIVLEKENSLPTTITDWLFHKLISVLDVGYNILHLNVVQQL